MAKEKKEDIKVEDKKTIKKAETKAKEVEKEEAIKVQVETEKVESTEVKESFKPQRKKTVDIELSELIPVRSVTKGGLNYVSRKTNNIFRWQTYGEIEYMEYSELVTMKASRQKFLTTPLLVIDDEDVVEKLGFTELYKKMFNVDELDDFFRLSVAKMKEKLSDMPEGFKVLVRDKATEKIKNGSLDSLQKIKLLEKEVRVDLQIIME